MNALSRMLAVCMVALTLNANAQPKTAPSWSAKFKTAINWQRVHSLGYLIVSTNDGLYGVNPDDGKIIWENREFSALNPEYYQEVEGTEFLTIAYQAEKPSSIPMQAIIHVATGKALFDSKKEQIGVEQQELSEHIFRRAQQSGQDPNEFAKHMVEHNHIPEMVSEVVRGKALATLVESAKVVDESGNHVELKNLRPDGTIGEPEAEAEQAGDTEAEETAEA